MTTANPVVDDGGPEIRLSLPWIRRALGFTATLILVLSLGSETLLYAESLDPAVAWPKLLNLSSEVNLPTWVMNEAFDSGFTMGLMRKDVRLADDLARAVSADLPLASVAARLWADSAARLDDGADFNRLAEAAWKDGGA